MQSQTKSTLKSAAVWGMRLLALVLTAGVLLSTGEFNQWWIRMWDFPRVQLVAAMVILGLLILRFDRGEEGSWKTWRLALPLAMAALTVWQVYRIYPYTPLAPTTVAKFAADTEGADACFSVLSLNVLQDNREYGRTLELIERIDADMVLLMETDQAWLDAMAPVRAKYETALERPLDNKYGIAFYTSMPVRDAAIRDLAQKDTPSVFGTMTAGGLDFRMIALHPRPPQPGQDTEERDAELVAAARHARDLPMPALAIGDFNDVAWSSTTELFMQTGQFLDPRIGRGTFATFPADMTWLGWPLDHLFVTDEFLLREMEVLGPVGSDHRPILARLCLDPATARASNAEAEDADSADRKAADEVMQEFEDDTAKDRVEGE